MELYNYLKVKIIKYIDLTIQGVYSYLDEVRNIILGQIDIQTFIYDDTDINDYLNDININEELNNVIDEDMNEEEEEEEPNKENQEEDMNKNEEQEEQKEDVN